MAIPLFFDLSDELLHKNGQKSAALFKFGLPFLFAMTTLVVNDYQQRRSCHTVSSQKGFHIGPAIMGYERNPTLRRLRGV